jgi:oxygen-independent coproporphyrinogen-3 oxidase
MFPDGFSIYIHLPFCRKRCGYCSFISYAGREDDIPAYTHSLIREIEMRQVEDIQVRTLYFGGGTPSLCPQESLKLILEAIGSRYSIAPEAEITLEANPGTISPEYLQAIRAMGINRLSLGMQSLDDAELSLLGRIHTTAEAKEAVHQAKDAGFSNINLDFIYGIPGRSMETWRLMLGEIVTLGAQHISLYGLTLEEDTPMYKRVKRGEIAAPDDDAEAEQYEMAEQILDATGYNHYEISNWALPGFESRHNLAYWKRTPYLGLGAAAHSFLEDKRIANTSNLDEYLSCLSQGKLPPQTVEVIDAGTALSEAIILGLRLDEGVSADDIEAHFSIDLYSRFAEEIAELVSLGLLERQDNRIRLTPRGRLLGNEVFIRFLA